MGALGTRDTLLRRWSRLIIRANVLSRATRPFLAVHSRLYQV